MMLLCVLVLVVVVLLLRRLLRFGLVVVLGLLVAGDTRAAKQGQREQAGESAEHTGFLRVKVGRCEPSQTRPSSIPASILVRNQKRRILGQDGPVLNKRSCGQMRLALGA